MAIDLRQLATHTEAARLFDSYGRLLTERQQAIFHLSFDEDFTLAEVAETLGISRQAVHENLRKGYERLEEIDRKLELISRNKLLVQKLREALEAAPEENKRIISELLTMLEA